MINAEYCENIPIKDLPDKIHYELMVTLEYIETIAKLGGEEFTRKIPFNKNVIRISEKQGFLHHAIDTKEGYLYGFVWGETKRRIIETYY